MSSKGGKKGLFTLLRVLVAGAILFVVFRSVPWEDRLDWVALDGGKHSVSGTVVDDWKGDAVRFELAEEATVPTAFPEEARVVLAQGEALAVQRWSGIPGESGYDWKPGMPSIVRSSDVAKMLQALGLFGVGLCIVVTRWQRLLGAVGCVTTWFNALRLTMIGLFFNSVVPGLTGGDLVKGVLVVRENPLKRADAVMSVIVDRLLGMVSLATLAAVLILMAGDTFAELKIPMVSFLVAAAAGALIYAAPGLRDLIRLEQILNRIPLGDKFKALDQAALLYFKKPLELVIAFVLSLVNHGVTVGGVYWFGRAFGVDEATASMRDFFVVIPVGNIVSALPLAPAGWGVGEFIYKYLFEMIGSDGAMGVAISIAFRLSMTFYGLAGGLFLLMPGSKAEIREVRADG